MKKKISEMGLIDDWLKFHDTTYDQVLKDHPEWEKAVREAENTTDSEKLMARAEASNQFLEKYAITQEQYNLWEKNSKDKLRKVGRYSKRAIDRSWPWIDLQIGPKIIDKNISQT